MKKGFYSKINDMWGGFLPFNVYINDAIKYNEYNKLLVLVNNELSETMIPCGKTATLSNGKR